MKVHVVFCHYDGCEDLCSSGAHVVGVFKDPTEAKKVEREHQTNQTYKIGEHEFKHLHGCFVDTVEMEVQ